MAPETIAGRYRVERAVGRGGMGTVWLCRDELLGRQVAVKEVGTLPGEATPDLARALREARSSAPLNHRNVVAIYDAVEEGDQIWLVMEYVPSRTLSQILAEDGPMSPERATRIGAQVADGLAAAHARRTIHRDVKPGNILVTEDDVAKVSDFGIARTHGDATLTQSGLVMGTPTYFSPELARGADPSPASDVWALGATLYAAVEGRPPYPSKENPIATLTSITAGDHPEPEHAGFLAAPITRMLDPDPRSRWSMADVAHALHRLDEQHAPSEATTAFAAPTAAMAAADAPTTEPVRPSRDVPFATTAAAAPPREPPSDAPAEGSTGRAPAPPEPRGRRDRSGWWLPVAALVLLAIVAAAGFALLNRGDGGSPGSPSVKSSSKSSPSADGSTGQSPRASDSPSDAGSSPGSDSSPAQGGAGGQEFAASYYAALPEDTRKGWSLLSPDFQSRVGSYGDYRGFWSTISSVEVRDTTPAGKDAVDVSLAYTKPNGSVSTEVRRLFLQRNGDSYLIASDRIIS
jgi:serine/threonine protein kinase